MTAESKRLMSDAEWRAVGAEFLAVLLFVFISAGSTVAVMSQALGISDAHSARLLVIAGAHGVTLGLMVAATAAVSGGHVNPAVTFGMLLTGRMRLVVGVAYVVAQLLGAVVGAVLLRWVVPDGMEGNLGSFTLASGLGAGAGVAIEAVLTFALVFVIFAVAVDRRGPSAIAPLAIGLVVFVSALSMGPLTGAALNPARAFGPALVSATWQDHWVYWIGPLLGGGLGALAYNWLFLKPAEG